MKPKNWKSIAELIGIAAIVASLIFVGFQMKQSQEIAIAAQYQARYQSALEVYMSKESIEFWARDVGEREFARAGLPPGFDEDTSMEELGYRFFNARKFFLGYDNLHFQYQSGFVTEEVWAAYRKTLVRVIQLPAYQHYWETFPHSYRSSYYVLVEEIRAENERSSQ